MKSLWASGWRPLGFHLWETLEFLRYHQGCSPGNDAHVRPDLWGQAASQESRDLLCVLWEAEGFPTVLEKYIWASWNNTQLKLLGKHSFIDKRQGTPKSYIKILIHSLLCDCLLLVPFPQPYMLLGMPKWKAVSVLWNKSWDPQANSGLHWISFSSSPPFLPMSYFNLLLSLSEG